MSSHTDSHGTLAGDQPDPSATPTILIGIIGTLVTVLIVIFCQILFRVTEQNNQISGDLNQERQAYEAREADRLEGIEDAMTAVVSEHSR